jgi:hypothetical protein
MSPLDVAELERLEKEATPGPWKRDKDLDVVTVARDERGKHRLVAGSYSCFPDDADSAFIAASRNALPELIAALKIAVEALKKLEGWEMVFRLEAPMSFPSGVRKQVSERVSSPASEALTEIRKLVSIE